MKSSGRILFIIIFTISLFSALSYIACTKKDKCQNVACQNGGACDGGTCVCPIGFEGPLCDTLSRDKFIFNYNGGDSCGTTPTSYDRYRHYVNSLRFLANLHKPLELTMKNFLSNPDDSAVCTIIKTDSFTFLGANNSTTYTGVGWLRHDTLRLNYHVIHDTTSYDCSYMGLIY